MTGIHALKPEHKQTAIETAAQAFYDDPMSTLPVPDPVKRRRVVASLYALPVNICMNYGIVDSNADAAAVAMWLPTGNTDLSLSQMVQVGAFSLPFKLGFGPFMRMLRMLNVTEKAHKDAISEPHWYLMTLAVRPEKQGQGMGSRMLEHGLKRVDADRLPAYLETANARNLPLYERFGFKVTHSGELATDGPPFWGMLREGAS